MKLKKHREDVLWLKTWPNMPYSKTIAKRYQRLIRMAEQTLEYNDIPDSDKIALRVLKDGKK